MAGGGVVPPLMGACCFLLIHTNCMIARCIYIYGLRGFLICTRMRTDGGAAAPAPSIVVEEAAQVSALAPRYFVMICMCAFLI